MKHKSLALTFMALMIAMALVASAITVCGCTPKQQGNIGDAIASSDQANLYKAGKFNVAVLEGDYLEMGRQYGTLLGEEIRKMYDELVRVFNSEAPILLPDMTLNDIEAFCLSQVRRYPKRLQDVMEGLSQTSGLEPGQLACIDQSVEVAIELFEPALVKMANKIKAGSADKNCSSIVVWGQYKIGRASCRERV